MTWSIRFLTCVMVAAAAILIGVNPAAAHPHVWVTTASELIYAPNGSVTAIRHAWTFDDMFSTYALQGTVAKKKGVYTREELAPLAQTNVESLKEYGFFTYAKVDGKKEPFLAPIDYFLDYQSATLVLHFTLPFKTPIHTKQLVVEIFDPSYFVDFALQKQDPFRLVGAPASCSTTIQRPNDGTAAAREARRGQFSERQQQQLRRDVREQDHRGLPLRMTRMKTNRHIALSCVAIIAVALIADGALQSVLAQNPFGGPPAAPDAQVGGVVGWLLTKQSEFYREMSSTIRAAKADGSAVWTLLAISFAYGIFHAAGPGHGKTVISSYLVANEETARRGIALSFVSALMQSLFAVLIVGIGAWLLNVTAKTMCGAERVIEIASYTLIAAFGVRLVWSKGGGFIRALRSSWRRAGPQLAPVLAHAAAPRLNHSHLSHDHGDHGHHGHHHHDHAPAHATVVCEHVAEHGNAAHRDHGHIHDAHCGHSHGPEPVQLAGPGGWRRGFSAVLTVGIRPCSGAILVLVFASAQGLFWAGVAATFVMGLGTAITVATIAVIAVSAKGLARRLTAGREGGGALLMRGVEFGAAGLVLLFGVGLLLGYIAAERVTCF